MSATEGQAQTSASSAPVAPLAPDAARNAALEDAAKICDNCPSGDEYGDAALTLSAERIRALKVPQQEGSEAGNGNGA